jgi:hypothetical protein
MDWNINKDNTAYVSYTAQQNNSLNDQSDGTGDLTNGNFTTNHMIVANFSLSSVLSPSTVNQFTAGYQYWNNLIASDISAPLVTFPSASFGTNTNVPQQSFQKKWQFRDDISKTVGKHTLKAGVDYIWNPVQGGFFEFSSTLEIDFAANPSVILGDAAKYPQGFATPGAVTGMTQANGDPYFLVPTKQLGLYFQCGNDPGVSTGGEVPLRFDGVKQRLRYRFADAGVWPVNVAIYGEVAELANEIELEAKIILDRRIGRWHLMANLWGEREFYYSGRREWVANPTGGVAFEVAPAFHVGVEYWMHGEFGATPAPGEVATRGFNENFHHYLGPAFLLQGSRLWVSVAPYLRLDAWDRDGQVGDRFGRFWFRTIIGLEL